MTNLANPIMGIANFNLNLDELELKPNKVRANETTQISR